jgi:predicted ATP-binding protein involved in virulence
MIVTHLKLANLRAIEAAEFRFRTGFNLIVGVNGVGKTSVLDALRICMSRVLPTITTSQARSMSFGSGDVRNSCPFLDATVHLDISGQEFRFTRLQWREKVARDKTENLEHLRRQIIETERLRDRARNLLRALDRSQSLANIDMYAPAKSELRRRAADGLASVPLCVFYSTNRAVVSEKRFSQGRAAGGSSAAYAEALVARSWDVAQFADWMRAQAAIASERPTSFQHIGALRAAATTFLPECTDLRAADRPAVGLWIDKAGTTLDVRQLSDGERGILSMALDLARRISQANPGVDRPLQEGQATVLIDEIDLHLHPKWQRQIVKNLQSAFPRCQFIATTHSPQVIGEVEHDRIQIIADGQVYSPTHSYGVDSSRVLEEVMDADPRAKEVQNLLTELSQLTGKQQFGSARIMLAQLVGRLGENDPEVTRIRTLLDFIEGKE